MNSIITRPRDLAVANSRLKGGNDLRTCYIQELQDLLEQQWNQYPPTWFITLQWSPAPLTFTGASDHARHFRNKFLCAIYHCDLKQLPEPEDRCRLIWFHERAQDHKGRLIYHSHLHLTAVPQVATAHHLQWIIARKVAPRFHCLKHLNRKVDPGVVIKPWIHEHHAFYNLKDFYRFRHHQDHDLLLDFDTSDLIRTK